MIICVSANPAIDRRLHLDDLALGKINRARSVEARAGGKAAHVAIAAHSLGAEVTWLGFLGGPTGEECARGLSSLGIEIFPVPTKSVTRTNLEILEQNHRVTEVLEPGGTIEPHELDQLFLECKRLFEQYGPKAQVVLSGSLPSAVPHDFYGHLTREAQSSGCRVILDASGDALIGGLSGKPDLVKPNRDEAASAFGIAINDVESAVKAARSMLAHGAKNASVSLGSDGLIWLDGAESTPVAARPPAVPVLSAVGCGDATAAGFAVAGTLKLDTAEKLRFAVACGAANCIAPSPGFINRDTVQELLPKVVLEYQSV